MKFTYFIFLISVWVGFTSFNAKITKSKTGWLIYRYDGNVAFFPIKDQSRMPTYENFVTEAKEDGERMNGNPTAGAKLLLARLVPLSVSNGNKAPIETLQFYIQPVKYVYEVNNELSDTTNHSLFAGRWFFEINGKLVEHGVYHSWERNGTINYLTKQDSIFAKKGGRRNKIVIYPPH